MERGTKADSKTASGMDWASFSIPMETPSTETGFGAKDTARGSESFPVEIFTKENTSTAKEKGKALSSTPVETAIRGTGRREKGMGKASTLLLARNKEYSTKMENRSRSSKNLADLTIHLSLQH